MKQSPFVVFLRVLLSFSIVLSSPSFAMAASVAAKSRVSREDLAVQYKNALSLENPFYEAFAKDKSFKSGEIKTDFEREEALVDLDPFYMRSQKWVSSDLALVNLKQAKQNVNSETKSEFSIVNEGETSTIINKGSKLSLKINLPLFPIAEINEYLLFSSTPKIFEKYKEGDEIAEGIFYISKLDFYTKIELAKLGLEGAQTSVPLQFFALPDAGWSGPVIGFEWEDADLLVLYNNIDGVELPIELADLRDHHQHMKLNLAIARSMYQWSNSEELAKNGLNAILNAYPAVGSTAGLGSFLTGMNLESQQHSFAKLSESNKYLAHALKILGEINPKANADPLLEGLVSSEVLERMIFIGRIVGAGFVGSLALKYTYYRTYYLKKHYGMTPAERRAGISQFVKESPVILASEGWLGLFVRGTQGLANSALNLKDLVKELPQNINRAGVHLKAVKELKNEKIVPPAVIKSIHPEDAVDEEQLENNIKDVANYKRELAEYNRILAERIAVLNQSEEKTLEKENGFQATMERIKHLFSNGLGVSGTEVKGIFDVYAHALVAISKAIPVSTINILEYLGDRFATKKMGPRNAIMRKGFLKTFGWSRSAMKNIAVNSRTWFLGSIVMGSVDSALVAVQLLFVVPLIIGWATGVDPSVGLAGGAVVAFVTSEIIRNIIGYFKDGAYSYSLEQREIFQDRVAQEVNRAMEREGKNPQSKEHEKERTDRIEMGLEKTMKLRGLPGMDEFLFDIMGITSNVAGFMGYATKGLNLTPGQAEKLLFTEGRWGLVKPSLNLAVKSAEILNARFSSREGAETVEILKTLQKRWSLTQALAKASTISIFTNREYVKEALQVRQALTLLSYGGNLDDVIEHLPDWFKALSTSKEAVLNAARIYHNSLYSITEGDEDMLMVSESTIKDVQEHLGTLSPKDSPSQLTTIGGEELANAIEQVYLESPNDVFSQKLAEMKAIKIVHDAIKVKGKVDSYSPEKRGWYAQWQMKKALNLTEGQIATSEESLNGPEQKEKFKKLFAVNLSKIVGIHPKSESDFVNGVVAEAEANTQQRLSKVEEKQYMARLSKEESLLYEAQIFGEEFIASYIGHSVESNDHLDALSSEQPGFLQKFRQFLLEESQDQTPKTQILQKFKKSIVNTSFSKYANKAARVIEAFWNTGGYGVGGKAFRYAKLPFWHDIGQNFLRNMKMMPMMMTFLYATNYFVWQVQMSAPVWAMSMGTIFTVLAVIELNNRYMKNIGKKPMGSVMEKVQYAFWHSVLTFPAYVPIMLWAEPSTNWWNKYVWYPSKGFAVETWQAFSAWAGTAGQEVITICNGLLSGIF